MLSVCIAVPVLSILPALLHAISKHIQEIGTIGVLMTLILQMRILRHGLPSGSVVKESSCQYRRHGFHPWVGNIPWFKSRQSGSRACAHSTVFWRVNDRELYSKKAEKGRVLGKPPCEGPPNMKTWLVRRYLVKDLERDDLTHKGQQVKRFWMRD